jgi:predicted TIM-barrel fold metal-dependent hydrolase
VLACGSAADVVSTEAVLDGGKYMDALVKPPSLMGIPVVDADTHLSETYDLWTSRAPQKYKDRVPQVKTVDGEAIWVIDRDKKMGPAFPVCTIRKNGTKAYGMELTTWKFEDAFEGAHSVAQRLAYMDGAGICAQIVYPNLLGFGNQKAMDVDSDLRNVTTTIFNDAMAELQAESGDRIFPMALMPWWDINLAVKEAQRCHAMGLRGINTNAEPQNTGLPELGDKHWAPLWDLCSGAEIPVNFHIGGGFDSTDWFGEGNWPSQDSTAKLAFGSSLLFFSNFRLLTNIFISRFLEDFPKLKLVSVESGVGWIPFMLEAVEYQMREAKIDFKISPAEIFKRQIYGCSWFERENLVHSARVLGVDNVMFQTDFPHPVCLYPDALNYMASAADQFTPDERRKVFGGNADALYKIGLDRF